MRNGSIPRPLRCFVAIAGELDAMTRLEDLLRIKGEPFEMALLYCAAAIFNDNSEDYIRASNLLLDYSAVSAETVVAAQKLLQLACRDNRSQVNLLKAKLDGELEICF